MRPPPLADWLLWQLAPRRIRAPVIGDLHEEYEQFTLRELGPTRAKVWYWKQVLSVLVGYRSPHLVLTSWVNDGWRVSLKPRLMHAAFLGVAISAVVVWHSRTVHSVVAGLLPQPLPTDAPEQSVRRVRDVAAYGSQYPLFVEQADHGALPATGGLRLNASGRASESHREISTAWIGWEWEHDPLSAPRVQDSASGDTPSALSTVP